MHTRLLTLSSNIFKSLSFDKINNSYMLAFTGTIFLSLMCLGLFIKNFNNDIRSIKTVNFMSSSAFFALLALCLLVDKGDVYNNNFVSTCNTIVLMFYLPIFISLIILLVANVIQIFKSGFSKMNKVNIFAILTFIITEYLLYNIALAKDTLVFIILSELIGGIMLYFLSIFIGTVISTIIFLVAPPKYDKDFIIILGCKCKKNNEPSKLLKNRIDTAINFYKKQIFKTGKIAKFIVTGKISTAGCLSEAEIMANYLEQNGIEKHNIIIEKNAKNTFQNMQFCKEIVSKINKSAKCIFVTNDFHIFRSNILSNIAGLKCVSLSSSSKGWYYSFSRFLMECKGVFDTYKKYHIYACCTVALISIIIAFACKYNLNNILLNYT